jgi:hypothetical protein
MFCWFKMISQLNSNGVSNIVDWDFKQNRMIPKTL